MEEQKDTNIEIRENGSDSLGFKGINIHNYLDLHDITLFLIKIYVK
jgi:hypothetical protein